MERFRRLAYVGALTTLLLVAVGGLVRATNSGLGCLDEWPTCRGGWIAPLEYHAIIEYSHRAIAGIVVVLLVVLAVGARRWIASERGLRRWADLSVAIVIGQALLGRVVVSSELHAAYVTAHFVLAMALVAVTTHIAAAAYAAGKERRGTGGGGITPMAVGALIGTAVVLLLGAYVRERGAGLAFADWPLMGGELIPTLASEPQVLQFFHRVLAAAVGLHVLALAVRVRRDPRPAVRRLGILAGVAYLAQVGVGAANVLTTLAAPAVMGHVIVGALTWASVVALTTTSLRIGSSSAAPSAEAGASPDQEAIGSGDGAGAAGTVRAYVRLTKPGVVRLLLITTVPAMVLAARGFPSLWLILATLVGGTLTAGSANAINQFIERDIDERMSRTRSRPLPTHSIPPHRALVFGVALGVIGFVWLALLVNLLAAVLAVSAIGFYVFVYTMWLKPTTPQNIVIGGAAGAVPVLVGWAAVTGGLGVQAWILFAIIFFWTPPHFWALAMRYRDDYAAAGVPMLPVVRGFAATALQILLYTVLLVGITLLLHPVARMGLLYAAAALLLGGGFVYLAVRLWREPTSETAIKLFRYSISYLALLFGAIAVDRLIA